MSIISIFITIMCCLTTECMLVISLVLISVKNSERYEVYAETYPVLNSWSDVASSASSPCSSSSAATKCTSNK